MKTLLSFLIISVLLSQFASQAHATEEFQVRPPVFPRDLQVEESYFNRYERFKPKFFPPLMYFTLGLHTESTWFDRRLAWDSYSAQFVYDTGIVAARLQGAFSSAGPAEFTLVDSRIDVYAYYPEQFEEFSFGGGLSYFDSNPYTGFEFLEDQHFAAFVNVQYFVFEAKFAMLINDDFWNGGLLELKLYNAMMYSGLGYQNKLNMDDVTESIVKLVLPSEIGLTCTFGLPGSNDGWGWFIKNRYVFIRFSEESVMSSISDTTGRVIDERSIWGICGEFYWKYKGGIGNARVSESWEFGIKFTLVGF